MTGEAARMSTPEPTMQGPIDGLCGFYTVLNSCKLTGVLDALVAGPGGDEEPEEALFAGLCKAKETRVLFPKIVWNGTEGPGMARILRAAQTWTERHSRLRLDYGQPALHRPGGTIEDYFNALRGALRPGPGERKAFILGLAEPWDHWTVVRAVGETEVFIFDSWGFPDKGVDNVPIADFTLDPSAPGVEDCTRHLIDTKAGFLLTSRPKAG